MSGWPAPCRPNRFPPRPTRSGSSSAWIRPRGLVPAASFARRTGADASAPGVLGRSPKPQDLQRILPALEDQEALGEPRPRLDETAGQCETSRLGLSAVPPLGCGSQGAPPSSASRASCASRTPPPTMADFTASPGCTAKPSNGRQRPWSNGTSTHGPLEAKGQGDRGQGRRPHHLAPRPASRLGGQPQRSAATCAIHSVRASRLRNLRSTSTPSTTPRPRCTRNCAGRGSHSGNGVSVPRAWASTRANWAASQPDAARPQVAGARPLGMTPSFAGR